MKMVRMVMMVVMMIMVIMMTMTMTMTMMTLIMVMVTVILVSVMVLMMMVVMVKVVMTVGQRYLLSFAFVGALTLVVDTTEVGHDHGHRQRYDEHTAQRTETTHDLTSDRVWHHVAVPTITARNHVLHGSHKIRAMLFSTTARSGVSWEIFFYEFCTNRNRNKLVRYRGQRVRN